MKNHLATMQIIIAFVHTQTGEFYLSRYKLAEILDITEEKAKRILKNLEKWGYITKIGTDAKRKNISIYKLNTYNFNEENNLQNTLQNNIQKIRNINIQTASNTLQNNLQKNHKLIMN